MSHPEKLFTVRLCRLVIGASLLAASASAQEVEYAQIRAEAKRHMEIANKEWGMSVDDVAASYRPFPFDYGASSKSGNKRKVWLASQCNKWRADPERLFGISPNSSLYYPTRIAVTSIVAESILLESSFPPTVWRHAIESVDRQGEISARRGYDTFPSAIQELVLLSNRLNNFPARYGATAASSSGERKFAVLTDCPSIHYEQNFGSGRALGTITVNPPGGLVALLPAFIGNLCKLNKIDPYDTNKCKGWRDQPLSFDEIYTGQYYVRIKWPSSGRQHSGDIIVHPSQRLISLP